MTLWLRKESGGEKKRRKKEKTKSTNLSGEKSAKQFLVPSMGRAGFAPAGSRLQVRASVRESVRH